MTQKINKAEGYELVYQASSSINFATFDYRSVKQSIIDYLKIYHAESFSDYIESSELIAIVESFAYVCELIAYRVDMNAHENTMDSAKRKDMVLKLARTACYNASRVQASSGLVKIDSISTTERLIDSRGRSLSSVTVKWNDPSNSLWKEQFFVIFNKLSRDMFGSVSPARRVQIGSVLYEQYDMSFSLGERGVLPITIASNNKTINYELVPMELTFGGPTERRPSINPIFSLVYAEDGLGDDSDYTGMFMLIKQGTLFKTQHTMNSIYENQTIEIDKPNVNQTDVWLTQLIGNTHIDWFDDTSVDTNIAYSPTSERTRYTIDTLSNDKVRIVFGNGEFAENPDGQFELWYRTSDEVPTYVPKTAIQRKSSTFSYTDDTGRIQTATVTYSLVDSIQNGSESESIEHIKKHAPLVYSAQNRMVSARDHNVYPLKDSSIVKVKTVNRTFAGDSLIKSTIGEPSGTYQDVRVFNTDGTMYEDSIINMTTIPTTYTPEYVVQNVVQSLLSHIPLIHRLVIEQRVTNDSLRLKFDTLEFEEIVDTFKQITSPWPIGLQYANGVWTVERNVSTDTWDIIIDVTPTSEYRIMTKGIELVFYSKGTNFYADNDGLKVYSVSDAVTREDTVKLIKANTLHRDRDTMFTSEISYRVLNNRRIVSSLYDNGLADSSKLTLTTFDVSGELVPDNIVQHDLFDQLIPIQTVGTHSIETKPYVIGMGDVTGDATILEPSYTVLSIMPGGYVQILLNDVQFNGPGQILRQGSNHFYITNATVDTLTDTALIGIASISHPTYNISDPALITIGDINPVGIVTNKVTVQNTQPVTIRVKQYVYLEQVNGVDIIGSESTMVNWAKQYNSNTPIRRVRGRSDFNFMWSHKVSSSILVNPSPTNIHDMFILTRGYIDQMIKWLNGELSIRPQQPSPLQLQNTYPNLVSKSMMSDTVIMKSGNVKVLFGPLASTELRASIFVIRNKASRKTDNMIKRDIVEKISEYFDFSNIEFGQPFYFSGLEAHVVGELSADISSFVIVPQHSSMGYGDLQQIYAREDEVLYGYFTTTDIAIVESLNPILLRQ